MGKIALLVSREEMLYQAHNILQEKKYEIEEMRVIKTEDAVSEARQSIAGGASIIIARGLQASLIKQYTDIPVVEIVLTAQEMALLIIRAKQILKKETPVIAVVGFRNMFCDMSYFDSIYEIELRSYFAERGERLEDEAGRAVRDGVDLIIGGDTAVEVAGEAGIPSLFLSITEDSLRNAFTMAESMDYAMNVEKRNAAQIETLLDYSFNGVTRMDGLGIISDINPIMENILDKKKEAVAGLGVWEVYRELDRESLRQVLEDGKESYSLFMQINRVSLLAMVAPVVIDGHVDGAILTCHRMKKRQGATEAGKQKKTRSFIALGEFDDILQESKAMQECIHLAKLCALSEKPVLIMGEAGTEKRILAQSIHNAGLRREGPFVNVSCDGMEDEAQLEMIFGNKGAVAQAVGGSILLEDVCYLARANQYRLYQLICHKIRMGKEVSPDRGIDVRVMVTTKTPLGELLRQGRLRDELYYLLEGLTVQIPPLRSRPEDLKQKIENSIQECCEHYSRYHVLTQGAMKILLGYLWEGNLLQVENFCERLVLTANKRSLDELAVQKALRELYPDRTGTVTRPEDDPEAIMIIEKLQSMRGNRQKTAKALGISKATLWRKMKKYEID